MMKRPYYLLLIFCFFSISFFMVSCGFPEREEEPALEKPFFWKVEKEGKVSYLLGTIHIGISLYELSCSDVILKELRNSDLVFVEVVTDGPASEEVEPFDSLSPNGEDFKKLNFYSQKFLRRKGVSSEFNCTALNVLVETLCIKEAMGASSLYVEMDGEVESIARAYDIPLKPLDSSESLDPVQAVFTCEHVDKKIEYYPICLADTKDFFQSYKDGSLIIHEEDRGSDYNRIVLKQRNELWLSKFVSAHNNYDRIFVAAGAAHFIGAFSFIDMLESEGFSVERVSCQKGSL